MSPDSPKAKRVHRLLISLVLVLQKNYGDEHRHGPPVMSDNVHVNALFNDVTVLYTAREHHEKQNPAHVQNVTLK